MNVTKNSTAAPQTSLQTQLLPAEADKSVLRGAEILQRGGLVAMPTETVYGLAAHALDEDAVEGIFRAKQRPHWDPLIVHISDEAMLARVVAEVPPPARKLMDAFWPGPLTMLLPRSAAVPDVITAGRALVGVRMPAHPAALALIRAANLPLAAPSANRFGGISPTTAAHVLADLDGRIDAILDAGPTAIGVESTVIDPIERVLYRQGGVSQAEIEAVLGEQVTVYQKDEVEAAPQSLPSPGVGIRHYAPRARLLLVADETEMRSRLRELPVATTAAMMPEDWSVPAWQGVVFPWSDSHNPVEMARTLYSGLRALDAAGVTVIVCPVPPPGEEPLVEAIRDRLMKAAREK